MKMKADKKIWLFVSDSEINILPLPNEKELTKQDIFYTLGNICLKTILITSRIIKKKINGSFPCNSCSFDKDTNIFLNT